MRAIGVIGVAVLVALVAGPVLVSAHVNDVRADPQVSADGTVVVETVFIGADGWVVLHAANGSGPGEPIGHAAVSSEGGLKEDVRVRISPEEWQTWSGNRTVWAVLHADDGDGQFEPGDDEVIEQFEEPAAHRFAVRRGDSPAYVTARGFAPETTDDATVTIRAVALPGDGHVVVRNATGDGPGEVVGATALPAGTSRNVSVELDDAFFRSREGSFALRAVAYTDDGDGTFDEGDAPIRVGERLVQTRFGVEKTDGPTPTGTSDSHDDHEHTHSPTPTGASTTTPPTTAQSGTTAGDHTSASPANSPADSPADAPGFGAAVAVAAVLLTLVAVRVYWG